MAKKRGTPESRWLAGSDPTAMLALLGVPVSERKLRLFACACCRRIWHQLDGYDEHGQGTADLMRAPVAAAEGYADGLATQEEMVVAAGWLADFGAWTSEGPEYAFMACGRDAEGLRAVPRLVIEESRHDMGVGEPEAQAALLRDVFGNPFRPITLAPAHRTAAVVSLARAAYDERRLPSGELDPHRLAVLADALEAAGFRGCWAVDALLDKTNSEPAGACA